MNDPQRPSVPPNSDVQLLLTAIQKNLLYQRFLHHQLTKVEELTQVNNEKQRVLHKLTQSVSTTSTNQQLKRSIMHSHAIPQRTIFAAPWFIDDYGFQAPPNPDSATFIQNSTTFALYPNYLAVMKRTPLTPYHYYFNLSSPIQNPAELQFVGPPLDQPLEASPTVFDFLPDPIQQLIVATNTPLTIPTPIAAQIIPKLEYFSPTLSPAQTASLWRAILSASLQFHQEQLQFLSTLSFNSIEDNRTGPQFEEAVLHNRSLHPFYNSTVEDIVDGIESDVNEHDELSLPTPIQLFEHLTGSTFGHNIGLPIHTTDIATYQSELTQLHPQVLEQTHPHVSTGKAYFNPLLPQDSFYLLSILRYNSYLDDTLTPIQSTQDGAELPSIVQYFSTVPISWLLSTYTRRIYQQYFQFYHLDQFQLISQLFQSQSLQLHPLLTQSPIYQSLSNHISNLPPPPASILASFNTLLESNISTVFTQPSRISTDASSKLVQVHQQLSNLWQYFFHEQYPYEQIPLNFINFAYLAQHVVKNGSTAISCYNYIMNDRQPHINEVLFLTIVLYYFWFYEKAIQSRYYAILAANATKSDPDVQHVFKSTINDDDDDMDQNSTLSGETDTVHAVAATATTQPNARLNRSTALNSLLGPEIASTGVYQQRLDFILSDADLISLMMCELPIQQEHIALALLPNLPNTQIFAVDMRIQPSFTVIFNIYNRCMALVAEMEPSARLQFCREFGQSAIFQVWNFPSRPYSKYNWSKASSQATRAPQSDKSKPNTSKTKGASIDAEQPVDDSSTFDVDESIFTTPLPQQPSVFILLRAYKVHFEPILIQYCKWVPILCPDNLTVGLDTVSDYIISSAQQHSSVANTTTETMTDTTTSTDPSTTTTTITIPTHIISPKHSPSKTTTPQLKQLTTRLITLPSAAHLDFTNPSGYLGSTLPDSSSSSCDINMNPFDDSFTDKGMQDNLSKHLLNHPVSTDLNISSSESEFLTFLSSIHQPTRQITPPLPLEDCGTILQPHVNFSLLYPTVISPSLYHTLATTDLAVIYQWLGRFFPTDGQDNSFVSAFNYAPYVQSTRTIGDTAQSSPGLTESSSSSSHHPWSFEEDLRLILAVKAHTRQRYLQQYNPVQLEATISWPDVAVHVPTRLPHHCRHRYFHVLSKYQASSTQ